MENKGAETLLLVVCARKRARGRGERKKKGAEGGMKEIVVFSLLSGKAAKGFFREKKGVEEENEKSKKRRSKSETATAGGRSG